MAQSPNDQDQNQNYLNQQSALSDSPTYGQSTIGGIDTFELETPTDISVVYTDTVSLGKEISTKTISTTFGRDEDYIELHIKNTAGQLIYSETRFEDYVLEMQGKQIVVNAAKILSDRGYISGKYIENIHPFRDKIFHSSAFPFDIKEVSTTRREVKSVAPGINNRLFDEAILNFILEIESAAYFKEFVLNFGGGVLSSGINLMLNKETLKHELILKTLDPLPDNIKKRYTF